jgi:uncharacterized damage-inducible protein DinB
MLGAVARTAAAMADDGVSTLLHHVLLANTFWVHAIIGLPFALEEASRRSRSFDELVRRFGEMQEQESRWLEHAREADLARELRDGRIPGGRCSVAEALLQMCLHAHGHRAQIATRLRALGGVPPATDFITWLAGRPGAVWPPSATPDNDGQRARHTP